MSRNKKMGLWVAGVLVGLTVILVVSSLLGPLFIDQQAIREKLQNSLARSMGGTIDFERLDISLIPPRGRLNNISLSIPGQDVVGTAESAAAYLKILPLFTGRVEFGSVEVRRPDFRVGFPQEKPEPEKSGNGLSLENLAGGAYAALAQLRALRPDLEILIREGRLSLTREGEPVVVIRDLDGRIELPPDEIGLDIRSASNIWENFRLAARVNSRLEGKGRMEFTHLQPHLLMPFLFPNPQFGVGDSQVDANIRFEMEGYPRIEGDVEASAPKLTLRRGHAAAPVRVDSLKGKFRFAEREMQFVLTELSLGHPGMKLSGRLHLDQASPSASMELTLRKVNVNSLRESSLALAGDLPIVKKAFDTALGGTIEQAVIASKGKSLESLIDPNNMDIKATVDQMRVHVPDIALDLEGGTGRLSLSRGLFKGEDLAARSGDAHASNGKLSLGIQGEDPAFHLDVNIRTDLAQVPSMLAGIVEDKPFLEEMKKVGRVEGAAQGRLVLGDRLHSIRAKVEIAEMSLRGEYEDLPYPVEISRGRFTYEGTQISWKDLDGRMGRERIAQTEGKIDWGQSPRLALAADQAVVDLEEIQPWISAVPGAPTELKEIRSMRGRVSLSALRLQGPLRNPSEWAFETKGEVQDTLIESPRLPGILKVSKAGFIGNPERIQVDGAQVSLSDADLGLSGAVQGYLKGVPQLSLDFQGKVGPAVKEWISEALELPLEMRVRAPLSVSKGSLVWGKGQETAFQADFTVAGGSRITLDMVKGLQEGVVDIRTLTIDGTDGRASMSLNLGEKAIDFGFKGNLSAATTQQILEKSDTLGWMRGDFTARILKDNPLQSTLSGNLEAADMALPDGMKVHRISLNGSGNSARIDFADFGWKGTEVTIAETDLSSSGKRIDVRVGGGRLCEISTEAKGKGSEPTCDLEAKEVSGHLDFSGKEAKGLSQSLQGKFAIKAGQGRIYRFGLLSKILAVVNITEILKGDAPDLSGKGFGYNSASFEGEIQNGVIDLKEGSIDARSMGLAFEGIMNLPEETLDMTVLVAPLKTVGSILDRIPLVSGILGKDFIAIPVKVKGDWSDPTIIPLSPSAVGSKLLGIVERTLKLPLKPFQSLFGDKEKKEGKNE